MSDEAQSPADEQRPAPSIRQRLSFAWNWRASVAHRLLLSAFLEARRADDLPPLVEDVDVSWETALGEPPSRAIHRFWAQGALAKLSPQERLSRVLAESYTVDELQDLLREHDLPVSGRKAVLVERLAAGTGVSLYHLLPADPLWRCTPYGRKLVADWMADSKTFTSLQKAGALAAAVLTWLIVEAIAPELIGSYVYDLLRGVDKEAARDLKKRRPRQGRKRKTRVARDLTIEWITVPAGRFWMGSDDADPDAYDDEKPRHRLYLPGYQIGKYPVTNRQYAVFVRATGHRHPRHWENGRIPSGKGDHPVVWVSWSDAVAFCEWATRRAGHSIRLPTEAEWEKAARGPDGRRYPWGNRWLSRRCNTEEAEIGDTTPVDRYPGGVSPYGVWDMIGNVWEWTSSARKPYPYRADDGRERMSSDDWHVLRGGAYWNSPAAARAASRSLSRHDDHWYENGFRLAGAAHFSRNGSTGNVARLRLGVRGENSHEFARESAACSRPRRGLVTQASGRANNNRPGPRVSSPGRGDLLLTVNCSLL